LKSVTFSIYLPLQLKTAFIFIYMAFVFFTFIYRPLISQNDLKASNIIYKPSALGEIRTASSAKASKKICNVAISNQYRFALSILLSTKYYKSHGYT
jgi:hypothetical protein